MPFELALLHSELLVLLGPLVGVVAHQVLQVVIVGATEAPLTMTPLHSFGILVASMMPLRQWCGTMIEVALILEVIKEAAHPVRYTIWMHSKTIFETISFELCAVNAELFTSFRLCNCDSQYADGGETI